MTVRKMQVEEEWVECDGCGYALVQNDIPVSLKVNNQWFHFHNAEEHGYDCFGYWVDKVLAQGASSPGGAEHFKAVSGLFKQATKVQRPIGV